MRDWKNVKLSEIGNIITGKTPKTSINSYWENGDILFLTPSDNMENKYIDETKRTITHDGMQSVKNCYLSKPSVCVSCIGSDLGKVVINKKPCVTNQQINSLICKDIVDLDFIYYRLLIEGKKLNYYSKTSTAVPIVNKTAFSNIEIPLPPLPTQRRIAAVLSSLDDKIENNRKTAEKLDEIAQAVFKRWFVDFEFPNKDGKPYKSSGGEMVYCDELGKEIPKGWECVSLMSMAEFINGLALKKFPPKNKEDELKVLKIKELRQGFCDANSDVATKQVDDKYIINAGDLIFSWSGSLMARFWTSETCFLNQHLFNVKSKDGYNNAFVYLVIEHFIEEFRLIASSKATTMGHIKRSDLENSYFSIDNDLMASFNEIVMPAIEKLIKCGIETERLQQTRDALLPKLMNGEIELYSLGENNEI